MSGRSALDDPIKIFNFIVEVDGFRRFGFMEANGLEQSTEVVEYREGGDNATVRKSAGLTSFANVTLRRGQLVDSTAGGEDDMISWAQEVHETNTFGAPTEYRRTFDIVQLRRDGVAEVARWRCFECWPVRFKPFSDLNALGNEDSIEELEVAMEGLTKISGSGIGIAIATPVGSFGTNVGL